MIAILGVKVKVFWWFCGEKAEIPLFFAIFFGIFRIISYVFCERVRPAVCFGCSRPVAGYELKGFGHCRVRFFYALKRRGEITCFLVLLSGRKCLPLIFLQKTFFGCKLDIVVAA